MDDLELHRVELKNVDTDELAEEIRIYFEQMSNTDQNHILAALMRVKRKAILKDWRGRPRAS